MGYWYARLCAWRICEMIVPILEKHENFDLGIFYEFTILPLYAQESHQRERNRKNHFQ
jgi:hypothetical protein